jgi:streptogramin lyase
MKKLIAIITGLFITLSCYSQQKEQVILTNSESDIIPEGIAVSKNRTMYVTSIARKKILAIDEKGHAADFIKSSQDGFLQGLGIKIAEKKQWVWVVSNEKQGDRYISKVHAFDIRTKKVQQQYSIEDTARHLFNDLTLDTSEKIYITDTYGASVYEVDPSTQKIHLFIQDSLIAFPNGIASNNKGEIYIATYSHGLMKLDLVSKKLAPVTGYTDSAKAFSLDGILYYKNSIIGVYNGAEHNSNNAIVQYDLNSEGNRIINNRIIDIGNKYFHEPTTMGIYNNEIYVIANSYLADYNANKESVDGIKDNLGSVTILVYKLE